MAPGAPRRPAPPSPAVTAAMAGAVDLAALKARSDAAARAAQEPTPAGGYVVEVDEASFQAEVLDRSFQVPVLLDLWAEWCQPCKQLSPLLEKLAAEGNGAWILAKIDVDANPRISQALQVQSIPTVFAVLGGQLVPGFQGALAEAPLREFVDAVLQAGQEAGLGAASPADPPEEGLAEQPAAPPEDPRFDAAEAALAAGDYGLAARGFQAILDAEPGNADAALALRQVHLLERVEGTAPEAAARADAEPDDIAAQLAAADLSMAADDAAGALRRLLAAVTRTSGPDRETLRQRLIEYFELLGPDDERVASARRELARALF
ncbi:MAG: tetratricopeptide repeat protein [Jatrophihabitantaceae bacterium]